MASSAQLRAARAYLDWTMDRAAEAAGIHRRTVIRLECEDGYAERQSVGFKRLVAAYRAQQIILEGEGLAVVGVLITAPTPPAADTGHKRDTSL